MSQSTHEHQGWSLPHLRETLLLGPENVHCHPYDVKFYPFGPDGADPIFAVISSLHILVYRIRRRNNRVVQLIQHIKSGQEDGIYHSLVWMRDAETGAPLVGVAGSRANIEIFDIRTGELRKILIGHGGDINDLAISPINPQILASASADNTIRLWNLDSAHQKAPCVCIYAGEGHRDTVLSIAFHASGRYLLSGGQDHVVCLWNVPELPVPMMEVMVIHFPLFSTSELHSNIVDCVSFHGDLVLSKAYQEYCIVLWRITGFDSSLNISASSSAPPDLTGKRGTRSSFSPPPSLPNGSPQYLRLLQFSTPACEQFYMRFSLSLHAGHPTLAICNSAARVFFWDLARFEEFHRCVSYEGDRLYAKPSPPPWLISAHRGKKKRIGLDQRCNMEPSNADSTGINISQHTTSLDSLPGNADEIPEGLKRKYQTDSPFEMVEAHRKETMTKHLKDATAKTNGGVGRQVAWSTCGIWCVVVADPNIIFILEKEGPVEASRG